MSYHSNKNAEVDKY